VRSLGTCQEQALADALHRYHGTSRSPADQTLVPVEGHSDSGNGEAVRRMGAELPRLFNRGIALSIEVASVAELCGCWVTPLFRFVFACPSRRKCQDEWTAVSAATTCEQERRSCEPTPEFRRPPN
jgi:hypothetical protein